MIPKRNSFIFSPFHNCTTSVCFCCWWIFAFSFEEKGKISWWMLNKSHSWIKHSTIFAVCKWKENIKNPFPGKYFAFSKIFDSNHSWHRVVWVSKSSHSFEIRSQHGNEKLCAHKIVNNQKTALCRLKPLISEWVYVVDPVNGCPTAHNSMDYRWPIYIKFNCRVQQINSPTSNCMEFFSSVSFVECMRRKNSILGFAFAFAFNVFGFHGT